MSLLRTVSPKKGYLSQNTIMEALGWTIIIISILSVILWVYAIADIVRGSLSGNSNKILWLIIVIFFPVVGALLYLLLGKK